MKKQKILLKLALISVIVIASMLLNPTKANANFENNNTLVISTYVSNWSNFSELSVSGSGSTSGEMTFTNNGDISVSIPYTKAFYLSDDDTFDGSDSEIDLSSSSTINSSVISESYSSFYLLEVYEFDISDGMAIDADYLTAHIGDTNTLSLNNISNENVISRSMADYESGSLTVYLESVYSSSEYETGRSYINYIYLSEGSNKTTELSRGSIVMPKFEFAFSGSATGNLLPYGTFEGSNSLASAKSGKGSYVECTESAFIDFANADIQYVGSDDNFIGSDGNHEYRSEVRYGANLSSDSDLSNYYDSSSQVYRISRSMTVSNNRENPTGVFFDVLPFVVAIVMAGVGVVLLKKNSIE